MSVKRYCDKCGNEISRKYKGSYIYTKDDKVRVNIGGSMRNIIFEVKVFAELFKEEEENLPLYDLTGIDVNGIDMCHACVFNYIRAEFEDLIDFNCNKEEHE